MSVATFEGIVENGQIRLPESVSLPEHAKVYVLIPEMSGPSTVHLRSPRLVHLEQAGDFEKIRIEARSYLAR